MVILYLSWSDWELIHTQALFESKCFNGLTLIFMEGSVNSCKYSYLYIM